MEIEIYKLHAAAADDVSRRRDSANRIYLGASTSIGITMAVVGGWDSPGPVTWVLLAGLAALGTVVQSAWLGVIQSCRQLNEMKFSVLLELEKKLSFDFYTKEYEAYGKGTDPGKYKELTIAEKNLPKVLRWGFIAAGVGAAVMALISLTG